MRRINKNTVELNSPERGASRTFEYWLDFGYNIDQAIQATKDQVLGQDLSDEFWEYLAN